ncbi:matrixin family metalloprotease [Myxococcota bacterium]|nr:matrixin family metalloprotease [Myxococcota bacterium]
MTTVMTLTMLALASAVPGPTTWVRATTSTTARGAEHCLRWTGGTELVLALEDCTSWDAECHARRDAIRAAIAGWNDVLHGCSSLSLSEATLTSRAAGYDASPGAVNENIVVFRDGNCRDLDCWTSSDELLAVTFSTFVYTTGLMVDADIELNEATYTLSTTSSISCAPSSPGCPFDVQAIVNHELGHLLGLGHHTRPGSLMHPIYGGLDQRLIDAGSAQAMCEIYPVGGPSRDCVPEAVAAAVEDATGPTCQDVGGVPGASEWILALGAWALGRRRAASARRDGTAAEDGWTRGARGG